jgi:hypothetical protein
VVIEVKGCGLEGRLEGRVSREVRRSGSAVRWRRKGRERRSRQAPNMEVRARRMKISMPTS